GVDVVPLPRRLVPALGAGAAVGPWLQRDVRPVLVRRIVERDEGAVRLGVEVGERRGDREGGDELDRLWSSGEEYPSRRIEVASASDVRARVVCIAELVVRRGRITVGVRQWCARPTDLRRAVAGCGHQK